MTSIFQHEAAYFTIILKRSHTLNLQFLLIISIERRLCIKHRKMSRIIKIIKCCWDSDNNFIQSIIVRWANKLSFGILFVWSLKLNLIIMKYVDDWMTEVASCQRHRPKFESYKRLRSLWIKTFLNEMRSGN